jgi:hypothetical protein
MAEMAKVKLALRALDDVLDEMPAHIGKLRESSGLNPVELELEFTGSIGIDKEGGVDVGGGATGSLTEIAAGGVPVTLKAGWASKFDNQGGAAWKLRVKFG